MRNCQLPSETLNTSMIAHVHAGLRKSAGALMFDM